MAGVKAADELPSRQQAQGEVAVDAFFDALADQGHIGGSVREETGGGGDVGRHHLKPGKIGRKPAAHQSGLHADFIVLAGLGHGVGLPVGKIV